MIVTSLLQTNFLVIPLVSLNSSSGWLSDWLIDRCLLKTDKQGEEEIEIVAEFAKQKCSFQGRIQDFKLRGAHLNLLRRVEGGANIFGVFRVKNHDFTPKNHIFSNFRGDPPLVLIVKSCLSFCTFGYCVVCVVFFDLRIVITPLDIFKLFLKRRYYLEEGNVCLVTYMYTCNQRPL